MINCRWLNNISPLKFAQLILVKIAVIVFLLGLILKKNRIKYKNQRELFGYDYNEES